MSVEHMYTYEIQTVYDGFHLAELESHCLRYKNVHEILQILKDSLYIPHTSSHDLPPCCIN